jgi:hypothetical protein
MFVPVHSKVALAINQLLANQAALYQQMAALSFHAPAQRNNHFRSPLFKPSLSWAFPLLLRLAVPQQVEMRTAADVMSAGMDAVAACRHHLRIIWLAVGVGVSLPVPVVVFHLFNRVVHS